MMDRETALQAWKQMRSEIDPDNWLFVGTINPEMVDRAIEALEAVIKEETNLPEIPDSWVPCSRKMPEEHEWIGTKQFGTTISYEVYVTFENPKGERFTKHLSFQNGKVPNFEQRTIDAFYKGSVPIAWMPLPEPWRGNVDAEVQNDKN